ncbi:hypothetical protein LCGC14_0793620 [marine sediment metagenome]|uniref:Uncharacterized protein n=1 Tax=marine sediment metagenome TaxID=412755 RepID=A0A0F9SZ07_9ZZZZ
MPGKDNQYDPADAILEMADEQRAPTDLLGSPVRMRARQLGRNIVDRLGLGRDRAEDEAIMSEVYRSDVDEAAALQGGAAAEAEELAADPFADLSKVEQDQTLAEAWPSANQIIALSRTKKHRAGMTAAEEDDYRVTNSLPPRGCLGDVPAREPGDPVPLVVGSATPLDVSGVPTKIESIDLRSAVSGQLAAPPKITRTLRTHPPRTGKLIVVVSGDGSPEGTHFEFEGSEAPGPVMGINIVVNVADGREMASGVVTCMVNGEARPIPVWVRFGKHAAPQSSAPTGSAPSAAEE